MHKKSIIIIALIVVLVLAIVPVFAIKPAGPSAKNGLQKGKNDHLYLYEKDPDGADDISDTDDDWSIVEEDGAWSKMNINSKKNKFVYNAHGLESETDYVLICYQDPWPGEDSLLLGSDTSDGEGNVHVKGYINYDELPCDEYTVIIDEIEYQVEGSKIWLVLATDFGLTDVSEGTGKMIGWTPSEYLFEFDLLNKQEVTEP